MAFNLPIVDEDILTTAKQTYDLEMMVEPSEEALKRAVSAALARYETRLLERVAASAEGLASSMREDTEPSDEGAAALDIFARDIRTTLPVTSSEYKPGPGDVVEVTLLGEVTVYDLECPHCGGELESASWSITDRYTGSEFHFDPHEMKKARVRLIASADPYSDIEKPYVTS